MKSVRFKQLVDTCGKPEIKALWGPAEADRELQRAIKETRLLTIHQENIGAKKDYGVIGFWPEHTAQYVLFPKSLKGFADRRVIGIDYSILEPEPAPRSTPPAPAAKPAKSGRTKAPAPKPARRSAKPPETPRPAPPEESKPAPETPRAESPLDRAALLREIHATLGDLEAGKAVPALRRLERLAARLERA